MLQKAQECFPCTENGAYSSQEDPTKLTNTTIQTDDNAYGSMNIQMGIVIENE